MVQLKSQFQLWGHFALCLTIPLDKCVNRLSELVQLPKAMNIIEFPYTGLVKVFFFSYTQGSHMSFISLIKNPDRIGLDNP